MLVFCGIAASMKQRMMTRLAASAAIFLCLGLPAQAQMRVSTGLHTSSGSCAGCDLSDKTMTGMTLKNANFSGSMFNRSNLSGGRFYSSDLSQTHFKKAFLARVEAESINMRGAALQDATLIEAKWNNSVLEKADLRRADMTRAEFTNSNFKKANLESAAAQGANFKGSVFHGARFDHANLQGAQLDKANFQNTKFGNAVFSNTTLSGANFSGADLSQVIGLTQAQLDTACGDWATQLPIGLSVSYCAEKLSAEQMAHDQHHHYKLSARDQKAAKRIDKAVGDLERLMSDLPTSETQLRRELQKIHSNMVSARRAVEK